MSIGGSVESVDIAGREFNVAADADGNRGLGGKQIDQQMNGNGTSRNIQTRVGWVLGGLSLEINDDNGDQEFIQDIIDAGKDVDISFTFVNGSYGGVGIPNGEFMMSTRSVTAPLEFKGPGKLVKS